MWPKFPLTKEPRVALLCLVSMGKFSHGLVASLGICGRSMKLHLLEEGDGDRREQRTDRVAGGCAGWLGDMQVCVRQFPLNLGLHS